MTTKKTTYGHQTSNFLALKGDRLLRNIISKFITLSIIYIKLFLLVLLVYFYVICKALNPTVRVVSVPPWFLGPLELLSASRGWQCVELQRPEPGRNTLYRMDGSDREEQTPPLGISV